MNKLSQKTVYILTLTLFIFLPFSSWLVSLSGSGMVSLFRDLLVIAIFLIVLLFHGFKIKPLPLLLGAVFILWALASVFWREASLLQWLKGFRFIALPILLFFSLGNFDFTDQQKKTLLRVLLIMASIIGVMAVLELFGVKLPLTTSFSKEGALTAEHFVSEGKGVTRLQSILAGPNALGLYLLTIVSLAFLSFKTIVQKNWLVSTAFGLLLILTFSRSAILGLILALIALIYLLLKDKIGGVKSFLIVSFIVIAVVVAGIFMSKSATFSQFFTHGDSSSLRFAQYERIWQKKTEIGLFGRGTGTAGPSSQYRLDGGENHWTENTYLDIFEELGLVGMLIYLGLIFSLLYQASKTEGKWTKTALILGVGFGFAGIFINYYTGQVAIFIFWLANILALKSRNSNEA